MPVACPIAQHRRGFYVSVFLSLVWMAFFLPVGASLGLAQEAPSISALTPAPVERQVPTPAGNTVPEPLHTPTPSRFDKAMFLKPLPADELASLKQYDGQPASNLMHDKQFHKLLKDVLPNCMFHYGRDMPMDDAISMILEHSREPVRIREGRYLVVSGVGPILLGRGFVWIDLQDGIGLGGFFFHPTNGEPTPSLAIFSRQVKEEALSMSELPPSFAEDLATWSGEERVSPVLTRYFISGSNRRILLEHDEDFCAPNDGTIPAADICEQMNADAADLDLTAAYYLDQVHYATNATAWMMGPEQTAFLQVRDRTCRGVIDPLPCRIRVTRERVHVIARSHPVPVRRR